MLKHRKNIDVFSRKSDLSKHRCLKMFAHLYGTINYNIFLPFFVAIALLPRYPAFPRRTPTQVGCTGHRAGKTRLAQTVAPGRYKHILQLCCCSVSRAYCLNA